jgi:hypothetical protein
MAGANNKSLKKAGMSEAEIAHVRSGQTVIHNAQATAIQHSATRREAAADFRSKAAGHFAAQRALQEAAKARKGALLAERQRRVGASVGAVSRGMLAARKAKAEPKLTTLAGSTKQVAWATDMRKRAIDAATAAAKSDPALWGDTLRVFRSIKNAKTWIDNGRNPRDHAYNVRNMAESEGIAFD